MPFGAFAPLPLRLGGSAEEGWAPAEHARLCADLTAVRRVSPLARLYVNQDTGSPFAASVTSYAGQNGVGLLYAPTVTMNGAGDVTLTWPAYWTNDYQVQYPVKIRQARATPHATAARYRTVELLPRAVRVRCFDAAGAAAATPFSLTIW
jgi:hypothetical protein